MIKLKTISLLFFVLFSTSVAAQATKTIIRGTVTDPHGAVINGARIIVRNQQSGLELSVVTDSAGSFTVTVSPGKYRLTVAQSGFASEAKEVEVAAEETVNLDFTLTLATLSEQIVIVSGSREEELREGSTTKVDVIPRRLIRDTGYETAADVLSEQPGIRVRSVLRRSPTVAGEQIQGIDSRQVLVLLDGQPLVGARGIKSGILNLDRQSVGRLDRIEVVKGASSALYGSEAIGGVINLITREPHYPLESSFTISGGSLGALDVRGDTGFAFKKLTGYLEAERHKANDSDLTPATFDTTGPKFHRNDLLVKLKYEFAPRFTLSALANSFRNNERGRSVGEQGTQSADSTDSAQNYGLTAEVRLAPLTQLTVRGYFAKYDEQSRIDVIRLPKPVDEVANLNQRYTKLDATVGQVVGTHQFLQGGVEWSQDQYRGFNRVLGDNAGQQVTITDAWVQDRLALHDRFALTIGGRYNHHSRYGSHAVPRASALVRVTNNLLQRASFGRGFRAPDLGQLYFRFFNPTNLYQVIGNPDLQPETSRTFQVGTDYNVRRFRLGISFFRNDVRNLIDTQSLGRPATAEQLRAIMAQFGIDSAFSPALNRLLFFYRNLANIYTSGVEAESEVRLPYGFAVTGAYTYLDARDKQTDQYLTGRLRHQGLVRASWADEKYGLRTNVRATFFSKWLLTATDVARGYQLWDWYTAKQLPKGTEVFLAVDNLFDSKDPKLNLTTPTFDRTDPGRTFRVGLRWNFHRAGIQRAR